MLSTNARLYSLESLTFILSASENALDLERCLLATKRARPWVHRKSKEIVESSTHNKQIDNLQNPFASALEMAFVLRLC